MDECPNCEWHKDRAARWRDEAYKQAGHPLPEREWVGLTDEDFENAFQETYIMGDSDLQDFAKVIEAKLKEKNT
jgi:hypothetical protein